jgi:hypothetical protein
MAARLRVWPGGAVTSVLGRSAVRGRRGKEVTSLLNKSSTLSDTPTTHPTPTDSVKRVIPTTQACVRPLVLIV